MWGQYQFKGPNRVRVGMLRLEEQCALIFCSQLSPVAKGERITMAELLDLLQQARALPALPMTTLEVLRLTQNPDATVESLAASIEKDPTLTAKLLKMVNSPMFGVRTEVTSIKQAVAMAGWRAVRVTALSASLTGSINSNRSEGFDYEAYWRSSLTSAVAARLLAIAAKSSFAEQAFVAGLLSQIGRLAAHRVAPDLYSKAINHFEKEGGRLRDAELAVLGMTGADSGKVVLSQWEMPASITVAVGASMGEGLETLEGEQLELSKLTHAATMIAQLFCGHISTADLDKVKQIVHLCTDLSDDVIDNLLAELNSHIRTTAESLSIDIGDIVEYNELHASAAIELATMSVNAESERVTTLSRAKSAETQVKQLNKEKKDILIVASTDGLTQIANRASFDQHLDEAMAPTKPSSKLVGILMIDVDHFKQFNDTHGHQAGDEVLREVAKSMSIAVADAGFVARFGGEEFAVILHCDKESQCLAMGEKVRAAIDSCCVEWKGVCLHVTASVGVATTPLAKGQLNAEQLLEKADKHLYEAKRAGRNRVAAAA
jgi:diguanylate cyclase (GGDEF)-like protein